MVMMMMLIERWVGLVHCLLWQQQAVQTGPIQNPQPAALLLLLLPRLLLLG